MRLVLQTLLFAVWTLSGTLTVAAPGAHDSGKQVDVTIHSDLPGVQFTILHSEQSGLATHDDVVKECGEACVVRLPSTTNYRIQAIGAQEHGWGDDAWLNLDSNLDVRVTRPNRVARNLGLAAGIGGSALLTGSVVLAIVAAVSPCCSFGVNGAILPPSSSPEEEKPETTIWSRHRKAWLGLSAGVAVISVPMMIYGFRAFGHNREPRLVITEAESKATEARTGYVATKVGAGWGLAAGSSF